MGKKRLSSIELLRILSMLMVIAYHWQIHAKADSVYCSSLSVNQVFSFAIGSWGTVGVNIFFMISAFFLLNSQTVKTNKICNLIIKVSIYGTVVVLLANAFNIVPFDLLVTIQSVLGIFAYQYWFLTVYAIIYVIHPCLNTIINHMSCKGYCIILATFIYATYFITFIFGNELLGRTACGISIYLLIGFLEKYPKFNLFNKFRVLGSVITFIGVLGLEIVLSFLGNNYNSLFFSCIKRIQITQSPIMLIIALFIFYFFKGISTQENNIINFLGKYSVGAYLLHGGAAFIKDYLWDGLFRAGYYYEKGAEFYIIYYLGCVIILFLVGVLCEYSYVNIIEKFINRKYVDKRIELIP